MAWTIPRFSKSEVDRAGAALVAGNETSDDIEIIDNWRAAHNFPLNTFQAGLRAKAEAIESCIISQRIKRLASITEKLKRFKTTRLAQMQDIGGCRAVMSSVAVAKKLADIYRNSGMKVREKDYIQTPKPDGYRGIHFVGRYAGRKVEYADLQIEIQIRSANQHAWATAVEIVGLFTQQALKSNKGHWAWRRFFACMGNAIAYRERGIPVPNTPTFGSGLRETLADYVERLDVSAQLRSYENALRELPTRRERGDHYFLLVIDPESMELDVEGYKKSELQKAYDEYSLTEQSIKGSGKNAVLVSVEKTGDLKKAYPNYFLDTTMFRDLVEWAIRPQ